ncbi:MAG: homoserine dehydrogenase, partial [Actinomyces sp. oral taxon 181]|nr:homoserine dehydrogenase [Actinomyces sp. oral taxon 181]
MIHLLQQWSDEYERRLSTRLEVQSVLVRRLEAKRAFPIDSSLLTTDPYEVIAGKDLV